MKKICLLGGSNSILKNGLKKGLSSETELINFAVGASSSLQNIYKLIDNKEIINNVDAIVTESNVNDSYNINNTGYSYDLVVDNIKSYYYELALTGKYVVVLILPVRQYDERVASEKLVNDIASIHLDQARCYGFDTIDLNHTLSEFTLLNEDVKKIMPDPLHPQDAFMYELGKNISLYISKTLIRCVGGIEYKSIFDIIDLTKDGFLKKNKNNSFFNEDIYQVEKELSVNLGNSTLAGIGTWSDAPSEIIIKHSSGCVVKQFNKFLSFNEIESVVTGEIIITSNVGKSLGPSESSINVPKYDMLENCVNIIGLLVKLDCTKLLLSRGKGKCLNYLIPSHDVYVDSITRYLKRNGEGVIREASLSSCEVDRLVGLSLYLEEININYAYELMKIAHKLRPNGHTINLKLSEYKEKIAKNK